MESPFLGAPESSSVANAIFAVLGFAYLFPYHAMIQPVDYWHHLFPDVNMDVLISLHYTIMAVTTLCLLVCVGGVLRYTRRIVSGLVAQVLVLGLIPAAALLDQSTWRYMSILSSSPSLFPQGALEHVQFGIGLSGLFAAILRVVSKACFTATMVETATMIYFFAGAVVVIGAFVAYLILLRLPVTRHCMHTTKQSVFEVRLLRKIWRSEGLVMLTYATSFIVFPGAISIIPSFQSPWLNDSAWWQLILLTAFATMDVVGRYAARWRFGLAAHSVWRVVAMRLLLVPLILCSVKGDTPFVEYDQDERRDQMLANLVFGMLGFAYLYPYWALTQPVDYWIDLFPSTNAEAVISLVYTIGTVVTLLALVCVGGTNHYTRRIIGGLGTQVLVLAALPITALVSESTGRCGVVIACTILIAIATSFLDSSVIGVASLFPRGAMEHVQLGIGVSGLFAAIFRVVSKAVFAPFDVAPSTTAYFFVGSCTVAVAIVAFLYLLRLSLAQRCIHANKQDAFEFRLLRKIWRNEALVILSYATTLAVSPSAISAIQSFQFPYLNDNAWWPLILLTLNAVMEVVGRYLARYRGNLNAHNVWKVVLARVLLVPLIVCSAKRIWLTHDVISIVLVTALAISNGYCGTLSVVFVNDCVDAHELSATGMVSSLAINVGLNVGAAVGFLLSRLLNY
ncbi:hypothetical protein LEN26_003361 [Aphanomyces euteiches]|nr:hypothetical protein LEN26_003361 [Aphanomyces euteiches]KAH9186972.1 hypothetical protein AeNC1_011053 [Aphanomyces euteiches]